VAAALTHDIRARIVSDTRPGAHGLDLEIARARIARWHAAACAPVHRCVPSTGEEEVSP
jgi:hypothetical protein